MDYSTTLCNVTLFHYIVQCYIIPLHCAMLHYSTTLCNVTLFHYTVQCYIIPLHCAMLHYSTTLYNVTLFHYIVQCYIIPLHCAVFLCIIPLHCAILHYFTTLCSVSLHYSTTLCNVTLFHYIMQCSSALFHYIVQCYIIPLHCAVFLCIIPLHCAMLHYSTTLCNVTLFHYIVQCFSASLQCLFYNEIPFTEDLRRFCFGPLPLTDDPASKKSAPSGECRNECGKYCRGRNSGCPAVRGLPEIRSDCRRWRQRQSDGHPPNSGIFLPFFIHNVDRRQRQRPLMIKSKTIVANLPDY